MPRHKRISVNVFCSSLSFRVIPVPRFQQVIRLVHALLRGFHVPLRTPRVLQWGSPLWPQRLQLLRHTSVQYEKPRLLFWRRPPQDLRPVHRLLRLRCLQVCISINLSIYALSRLHPPMAVPRILQWKESRGGAWQ